MIDLERFLQERSIYIDPKWSDGKDQVIEKAYNDFIENGGHYSQFHRSEERLILHLGLLENAPYVKIVADFVETHVPKDRKILDYGCGIGSLGLKLIERGYQVSFADRRSLCSDFLQWRAKVEFIDLGHKEDMRLFDVACCYNVFEHCRNPFKVLDNMRNIATTVAVWVNTTFPNTATPDIPRLHYDMMPLCKHIEGDMSPEVIVTGDAYKLYLIGGKNGSNI